MLGLLSSAAAADDVFFLSLDDTLAPLTADLMPIRTSGLVYIPCTVFDQRLTGVNLGVFYGQDKTKGTLTLYSRSKTIIFDINAGSARDASDGTAYAYRALIRNGRTYVPAYAVCQFFSLGYSDLTTDYGPLLRIKTGREWIKSDTVFISSAASLMSLRLNEYRQSRTPSTPTATPAPSASVPSSSTPSSSSSSATDRSGVRVYLAVRVESGLRLGEMLDDLEAQSASALFFFRPSQLKEYDDFIRRAAGLGCRIGLTVDGGTADDMERQIEEGNRLLAHILHTRTYTVLVDGTDSQRSQLKERGWLCWLENVDGTASGRSAAALVRNIMRDVSAKRSFARILMDDLGTAPSALPGLLRQLRADRYNIRTAVETEL